MQQIMSVSHPHSFDFSSPGSDAILDFTSFHHRDHLAFAAVSMAASHPSPSPTSAVLSAPRSWQLPLPLPLDRLSTTTNAADEMLRKLDSPPLQNGSNSPLSPHSPYQHSTLPMTSWTSQRPSPVIDPIQSPQRNAQTQHPQMSLPPALKSHGQPHHQQHHQSIQPPGLDSYARDPALMSYNSFPIAFPQSLAYFPTATSAALPLHMDPSSYVSGSTIDDSSAYGWAGDGTVSTASTLSSPVGPVGPGAAGMSGGTAVSDIQGATVGIGIESWHDIQASLRLDSLPRIESLGSNSPSSSYLEVLSNGDGWTMVDFTTPFDRFDHFESFQHHAQNQHHTLQQHNSQQQQHAQSLPHPQPLRGNHSQHNPGAIFNPGQTLHLRTYSSDADNSAKFGSFKDVTSCHYTSSPLSPTNSEMNFDAQNHQGRYVREVHQPARYDHQHPQQQQGYHHPQYISHTGSSHPSHHVVHELISPSAAVSPINILKISPYQSKVGRPYAASSSDGFSSLSGPTPSSSLNSAFGSDSGSISPRSATWPKGCLGPRKSSPIAKSTYKAVVRRTSPTGPKEGAPREKKVGRRRGPLRPEQRKQASEIRKLRACLRCKFLKKTCDKGEPCLGCQPSHARLWQVPCCRIDIKDIAYFMRDWKADHERHVSKSMSVYNVKGFSSHETLMWITHGYGYALPIMVREVFVADETCFEVDWVESSNSEEPIDFGVRTEKLDVGRDGIQTRALSEYIDKHIDGSFEEFVDEHFSGTPFVTEIFKTAHRYYVREKQTVIRKALKFVVAYNLTLHVTLVEQHASEVPIQGEIDDEDSRYHGKTIAPTMVNFQIKCALAEMWRELQREILVDLSALYSSVYSGDRLKNWPTIYILASLLLAVWEEMQFDCHYRVLDPVAVKKFCADMEATPVGVIVGLFHAISQKLPSFLDWNTAEHGQVLSNNPAICEVMTEVRGHVRKHETYLRARREATFDRNDFDSLSSRLLSKLVIRN